MGLWTRYNRPTHKSVRHRRTGDGTRAYIDGVGTYQVQFTEFKTFEQDVRGLPQLIWRAHGVIKSVEHPSQLAAGELVIVRLNLTDDKWAFKSEERGAIMRGAAQDPTGQRTVKCVATLKKTARGSAFTAHAWGAPAAPKVHTFDQTYKVGREAEGAVFDWLTSNKKQPREADSTEQGLGFDFVALGSLSPAYDVKLEVKFDKRASQTGHLFIERNVGTKRGWCQKLGADYHLFNTGAEWLIIPTVTFEDCPCWTYRTAKAYSKRVGGSVESVGYLWPLADARDAAIWTGPELGVEADRALFEHSAERNSV